MEFEVPDKHKQQVGCFVPCATYHVTGISVIPPVGYLLWGSERDPFLWRSRTVSTWHCSNTNAWKRSVLWFIL